MIVSRLSALLFAVAYLSCSMGTTVQSGNKTSMPNPQSSAKAIEMDQFFCRTLPTAVKVPGFSVWPNVVKLNRCLGGCHDIYNVYECTATAETKFMLSVYQIQQSVKILTVPMTEHTKCGCSCRVKPNDCNDTTQYYDKGSCSCLCKNNTCDNKTKKWNNDLCECECKSNPKSCIGYETKKIWSTKTCQCECIAKNVEKCKSRGKIMKPDTCECVCQPKPCPLGTTMDMKSCNCAV